MVLDPRSLETETPRTRDGRQYPEHLRPYEEYDAVMLEAAQRLPSSFTFDDLVRAVLAQPGLRDVVPRWVASAEWRQLLERRDESMRSPRTYALTERAVSRLRGLSAA